MELFYANRKSFSMVCFATAILYAFVVGVNQPIVVCIADGGIYGCLLFSTGLLLWNILRFAIPANNTPTFRIIYISVFAIITSLLITGIETFAFYLFFPSTFASFVPTLPVRVFITFLIFIISCLFYLYFSETIEDKKAISETISGELPMDSSQKGDLETESTPAVTRNIDRITVRSGTKIKIIPVENILYIQADGDYISIHTAEGKWLKEQTMNYTENRLPIDSFVRIHRSYIVNIHQISRIERYGEKQLIVLHNNEKIKISAARYQLLRKILGI